MTKRISCPARHLIVAVFSFAFGILLSTAASAVPSYCDCPPSATQSVWGELKQNTCSNLESNLYANLRSWANAQCGECGACFYSYTTHYPSCTITSDGFYTQAGTLAYACGVYVGPPCPECV
jgi:hypothetical protein